MDEQVLARLQRFEDIEAIRRLKYRYCRLCDDGYRPGPILELFTEDAVWDAGAAYGRHVGKDALRGFFESMGKAVSFSVHTALNGEIDVDGDSAAGQWQVINPALRVEGDRTVPFWVFSRYEDEFVRQDGRWLIRSMRSVIRAVADEERGWQLIAEAAASAQ